jgi:hypothetical protein
MGTSKAEKVPSTGASTITQPTVTCPVAVSRVKANDSSSMPIWRNMIARRLSTRSASTPP